MVKNQKGVWYLKTVFWCPVCGKEEWELKRQSPETPRPEHSDGIPPGFPRFHHSFQQYCGCMDWDLYGNLDLL